MSDDLRFLVMCIIAAVVMGLVCIDAAREKRERRTPPADDPTPTTHVDEFGNRWNARWFTPEVTPLERGRR